MNELNKYTTVESLLEDEDYVRWVQSGKSKSAAWTNKSNNLSIESELLNQSELMIHSFTEKQDKSLSQKQSNIWDNITAATDGKASGQIKKTGSSKIIYWLSAAAAACVVALIMFNGNQDSFSHHTSGSEMVSINLPDASTVTLAALSELTYNETTWTTERNLKLKGEAFFEVEKGKKFEVETDNLVISVLGTSFNVNANNKKENVTCLTGKVKVTSLSSNESVIITANEKAMMTEDGLVKKVYQNKVYIPWMEESITFDAKPLSVVFKNIEAAYQVQIEYPKDIADQIINAKFKKGTLEESLYNITWPINLNYSINQNRVLINKTE